MSASLDQILEVLPKKAFAYSNIFSLFSSNEIKDPVKKAQKIYKSPLEFQRLVLAKSLLESAYEIGYSSFVKNILPIASNLANDKSPPIRKSICNQIGGIAGFLIQQNPEEGVKQSITSLLPIIEKLIDDQDWMVRKSACQSLFFLSAHLRQMGNQPIITLALKMANGPNSQNTKCLASYLLDGLAETVGDEVCLSFFVPQVRCLAEDSDPLVRMSVAGNLQNICNVIGFDNVVSRIHPFYIKFCEDYDFRVRKSAVIHLPALIRSSPIEEREKFLPIMKNFLSDSVNSIQYLSMKILGEFFVSLSNKEAIDIKLLTKLVNFPNSSYKVEDFNQIIERDHFQIEHYEEPYELDSVPSLYLSFARFLAPLWEILEDKAWHHLQATLLFLHNYEVSNIREELAKSFHRIVISTFNSIKFDEANENDTTTQIQFYHIFKKLLLDEEVAVKINILRNLKYYLKVFHPSKIEEIIQDLGQIKHNSDFNWRIRYEISEQLENFWEQPIYGSSINLLLPLTLSLCKDAIFEVRRKAIQSIPSFLSHCCPQLISFAHDEENSTESHTPDPTINSAMKPPIEQSNIKNEYKLNAFNVKNTSRKDNQSREKYVNETFSSFEINRSMIEIYTTENPESNHFELEEFMQKSITDSFSTETIFNSLDYSNSKLNGLPEHFDKINFHDGIYEITSCPTIENGFNNSMENNNDQHLHKEEPAIQTHSISTEISQYDEITHSDNPTDNSQNDLDNIESNLNNEDQFYDNYYMKSDTLDNINQQTEIDHYCASDTCNNPNHNHLNEIQSSKDADENLDTSPPLNTNKLATYIEDPSITDHLTLTDNQSKSSEFVETLINTPDDDSTQPHSLSSESVPDMRSCSSNKTPNTPTKENNLQNTTKKDTNNNKNLTSYYSHYGNKLRALDTKTRSIETTYILMILNDFFRSEIYTERQSFIYMCDEIIRTLPQSFFDYFFSLSLASLSYDKVDSVRISWAKTLSSHFRTKGRLANNAILVECAFTMRLEDKIPEIQNYFNSVKLNEPALVNFKEGLDLYEIKNLIDTDNQLINYCSEKNN